CLTCGHDYVDFAPNSEIVEVHARLDRKPGPGQQTPIVVRLVIIHVHAIAVNRRLPKTVPRAMQDVIAVAGVPEPRRSGAIDLPTADLVAGRDGPLDKGDGRVACSRYCIERPKIAVA